ncbi:putative manganese-dependent inorganic diphosphatase [Lacrimispora sp. 210928-DFI.3.58]|uniref:putative manganese-dependent inorganic diphosphatase n=1 Tax=Lacrimispora sp. 210928-DFI.3.58 TaxID=2883214 RepID=UPI0015B71D62|nr:putative manganese-dependent inorganic diphosphatase [Lacrimispora sp. 210928-DFI.3.58]MCB7317422.1 putative manganese-dependent inorganic diphosphatase [Lacrimispora sp. 210928-DFI.3.58]
MEQELKRKTTVIGHRNPDTDSICSAICYANLKHAVTGDEYVPARAGHVNSETQYVLEFFGVEEPKLVEDVRTQVKDIEIRKTKGVADNISLKKAWNIMQENNVVTIPAVREDGTLEGLITVGDITKTYMNIYDSSILSKANTQYSNILETLEADILVGDANAYFNKGKVLIAAANPDLMEFYIEPHDLVILGNRYESQLCAIEMGADCIIVCEGAGVSMTIKKIAQDRGCTVIATTYDTYTAARLINQSMPISYFMTREHLITFDSEDYIDEIRDVMASKRHRDFPILDKEGRYLGMISRRNLLGARGKQVILVDHNEKSQAVSGIENAEILEIIDHHRLGTVQTMAPVFFRNQPLGCTATIIFQMYQEAGIELERKIAGLLCSAIVSDTLLFRSPTCTPVDEMAARALAKIAGLDIEKYAMDMFSAGSNLRDRTDEEIFYQDFKRFTVGKAMIGVGQITSLNGKELKALRGRMVQFMENAGERNGLDMVFFMLTNILTESTDLICHGQGAIQLAARAFHQDIEEAAVRTEPVISLPGVVSRKKQLIPELMLAEQE